MGMKIDQEAIRKLVDDWGHEPIYCERCRQLLNPATAVWLELSTRTGLYSDEKLPEAESQGCFTFGPDCARTVLAAGGECHERRIGHGC